jgi:hypothetical protein
MRKDVNPHNKKSIFGHDHTEHNDSHELAREVEGESEATIVPFPGSVPEKVDTQGNRNNWHRPIAFGFFGGIFGGILALPTIEMVESEHGFNTEVPGSIGAGALVAGGSLFIVTAVYKYFKP